MKFNNFLMLFSLVVVLVLMGLFGAILYTKTTHFISEKKEFIHNTRMNQIVHDVGKVFDGLYQISNNLNHNERLIRYIEDLKSDQYDPYQRFMLSKEIELYLYNIKKENRFVQNILVVTDRNQYSSDYKYIDFGLIGTNKWIKRRGEAELVPPGKTADYFVTSVEDAGKSGETAYSRLNRSMYLASHLTGHDGKRYGTLFVILDPSAFADAIAGHERFALLNSDMSYIFKGDQIQAKDGSIRMKDVPFHKLKVLYAEENGFHNKQSRLIGNLIIVTFILCIGMTFVASRLISGTLLFPVRKLIKLLEQYDPVRNKLNLYRVPGGTRKLILRDRFFIYFIVTILLPLTSFIIIFYWQSSSIMANEVKSSYYTLYQKNANEIEQFLNQKERIMARLAFDSIVHNALLSSPSVGRTEVEPEIHKLVDEYRHLGSDKDTIRIFDRNYNLLYSNRLGSANEFGSPYFNALKASGSYFGYLVETDEFGNHSVTLGIPIKHPVKLLETIGYVTLRIDSIYLQNLYANGLGNENETFLVDWNRQIISHPNKDAILKTFEGTADLSSLDGDYTVIDGKKVYVYTKKLKHLPWSYVSVYDFSSFRSEGMRLIYSDLYLIVIVFLLVALCSYTMAQRLLKPLNRLNLLFLQFELEDVDHRYADEDSMIDEVDQLSRTFNRMIEKIDDLLDEAMIANREKLRLEFEKRETQITALQAQINPHFLYNTLDTLIFMLEKNERDKAIGMVTALSRLFRYITSKDNPLVPLRDEINYARSYVELMKVRYDHIEFRWELDEACMAYKSVKFILQPIIENAIQHGRRGHDEQLQIVISAQAKDDGNVIELAVTDNGKGISGEELDELKRQLGAQSGRKIGIYNVDSRLKLHYGEEYGIRIQSEYGIGTRVTIPLPKR